MKKDIKALCFVVSLAMILAATGCGNKSNGKIGVKTDVATKKQLPVKIDISGALVPAQTVNISAKAGGQVAAVNVEAGQKVKAGDTVISLDVKQLNAQLQQAQAALESARAQSDQAKVNYDAAKIAYDTAVSQVNDQIKQAEINYNAAQKALEDTTQQVNAQINQAKINLDAAATRLERIQSLYASGGATKSQLDEAQTQYDTAKSQYDSASGPSAQSQINAAQSKCDISKSQYEAARGSGATGQITAAQSKVDVAKKQWDSAKSAVEQAQANVNVISVQLLDTDIRAPISGTVVNKNISAGEVASPGAPLLTIADTDTLKLKGTIPQDVVPFVTTGQSINVTADIFPSKTFAGTITSIGPVAASTGEYFPIEISIPNTGELSAGLSAHASINIELEGQLVVPNSAVVKNNGQNYLFVIKDGVAHKKTVKLGLGNDKEVAVQSGVEQNDEVAVTNSNNLFDGQPVTVEAGSK